MPKQRKISELLIPLGVVLVVAIVLRVFASALPLLFPIPTTNQPNTENHFALPAVPQPGSEVHDYAGIWSPGVIAQIDGDIVRISSSTGSQIVVISVPTGQDRVSASQAAADAVTIMDTWGVGQADPGQGLVLVFDLDNAHGYHISARATQAFMDAYLTEDGLTSIIESDARPAADAGDPDAALSAVFARLDAAVVPGGNPDRGLIDQFHAVLSFTASLPAIVVFSFFLLALWRRAKDGRMPEFVEGELPPPPPAGLTPAISTVLLRGKIDPTSITAALVDLGRRGLLIFRQQAGAMDWRFDIDVPASPASDASAALARSRAPLGPVETWLLSGMTAAGAEGPITTTVLRLGAGRRMYDGFCSSLKTAVEATGWFGEGISGHANKWALSGTVLLGLGVAGVFLIGSGNAGQIESLRAWTFLWPAFLVTGILGLAIIWLNRYMPVHSPEGLAVVGGLLADREILKSTMNGANTIDAAVSAANDRLPFIQTPDDLVTWATALGLDRELETLLRNTRVPGSGADAWSSAWSPAWFKASDDETASRIPDAIASLAALMSSAPLGAAGRPPAAPAAPDGSHPA